MYIVVETSRNVAAVHTHTHTIDLVRKNKLNINNKKGNISLPCGYYDTG